MSDDFIKQALEGAARSFIELMVQEDELKRQAAEVERQQYKLILKMLSLAALSDGIPENTSVGRLLKRFAKVGLTGAIRAVLMVSGEWMTPTQVRDQLIRLNVNLDKYKNPLASIHTTLSRLIQEESGSYEARAADKGGAEYRWVHPKTDTLIEHMKTAPPEVAQKTISDVASKFVNEPRKRSKKASKK